jgi:hypothetical protein
MFSGVPATQHVGEAGLLVTEILVAVNQPTGNQIAQLFVDCCVHWLGARDCSSIVLQAFLRVLGITVMSSEALGAILEAALQAFFKQTSRFVYWFWVTLHFNIFTHYNILLSVNSTTVCYTLVTSYQKWY